MRPSTCGRSMARANASGGCWARAGSNASSATNAQTADRMEDDRLSVRARAALQLVVIELHVDLQAGRLRHAVTLVLVRRLVLGGCLIRRLARLHLALSPGL